MQNTLYIAPRQSGKTSALLYEYYKSPKDTAVVVPNRQLVEGFKHNGHSINNFVGMHMIEKTFRGYTFKKILVDEYFWLGTKENKELVAYANDYGAEIIAFGTPKQQYDKELIGSISHLRKVLTKSEDCNPYLVHSVNYDALQKDYGITKETIEHLLGSLLTAPNTHIIHNTWFKSHKNRHDVGYLSNEAFELEMEAKYLK